MVSQRSVEHAHSFNLLGHIRALTRILFLLLFFFPLLELEPLDHSPSIIDLESFLQDLFIYFAQIFPSLLLLLDFSLQFAILILNLLHFLLFVGVLLVQVLHLLLEGRLLYLVLHVQLFGIALILLQSLTELILQLEQFSFQCQQLICIGGADLLFDGGRHFPHLVGLVS